MTKPAEITSLVFSILRAPTEWPIRLTMPMFKPIIGTKDKISQLNTIAAAAPSVTPYDWNINRNRLNAATFRNSSTPDGNPRRR